MKDFFRAFLSFGLATSIQKLLGFIILPIYTLYFNTEEYGIIDMTSTVIAVVSIFGLLQLETALQRYYYEWTGIKRKLLISNIYMWIGALSLLIAILLFIFAPLISFKLYDTSEYGYLIRIASIQLPLNNFSMLGLVLLRFKKENLKFLKVIIVNVISSLLFVYLFVINLQLGLNGVFYAQLLAVFLSTSLVTFYIRKDIIFRRSKPITKRNFKYALPQFPARIGSVLLAQANRFFMLGFLSLSAIGIYSVSMKLASSIQLVNTAFILAWAPFMNAQFKNKNNKVIFANALPLIAGVTFLFVCRITLYSKEMVHLLASEDFYDSSEYVGGLALFYSLYIIKETVDIGPKISEKTKYLSITFFLSVVVNISALYFLIQNYEIVGVVLAMIITNLFLVTISWFISNRLYYIPYNLFLFIILLSPALILSISAMFIELSLTFRLLISVLCIVLYSTLLLKSYKTFKELNIKL